MDTKNRKIEEEILNIINQTFQKDFKPDKDGKVYVEPLLGTHINIQPYELAVLLVKVEQKYHVMFDEDYLISTGVKSISDFSKFIFEKRSV